MAENEDENVEFYINRKVPPEILKLIDEMKGKRASIAVNHIKEHGYVTNEQLRQIYNYKHGPRAVGDAKDRGIPIKTVKLKLEGYDKKVHCYVFDDISKIRNDKLSGRKPLDKKMKDELAAKHGEKCLVCNEDYELRYLQTDHRVPYDIAGENSSYSYELDKYMLLCASCNRAKSWSCETCYNFLHNKDEEICKTCYWASPLDYSHIAMKEERRVQLTFADDNIKIYEAIDALSKEQKKDIPSIIINILKDFLE